MQTQWGAYRLQRWNCKRRGIKFKFTFEGWLVWWERNLGPNWFKMRGRLRHQYCMARINDKGIYKTGNVICITHGDNCKARRVNGTTAIGENHGLAKLTKKLVKEIYFANGRITDLAKKYGLSRRCIRHVKKKRRWEHVTRNFPPPPQYR
jgi:hypothetical protein